MYSYAISLDRNRRLEKKGTLQEKSTAKPYTDEKKNKEIIALANHNSLLV